MWGSDGKRRVERQLRQVGGRLRSLRDELGVIDEQLAHFLLEGDRTDEPHAEALAAHRRHVTASISELEARQDALLDAFNAS